MESVTSAFGVPGGEYGKWSSGSRLAIEKEAKTEFYVVSIVSVVSILKSEDNRKKL